jgi:hypothetical protein
LRERSEEIGLQHEIAKPAKSKWKHGGGKIREKVVGPTASDVERADLARRLSSFADRYGLDDETIGRRCNIVPHIVRSARAGTCVLNERERERFEKLLSTES